VTQSGLIAHDRAVLRIGGPDRVRFLQDLVTNDVGKLSQGAVYAALLSPQGKYLFDFFMVPGEECILIDVQADRAAQLAQRLTMYRLRSKVLIEPSNLQVVKILGERPDGEMVFADPRNEAFGWRVYSETPETVLSSIASAAPSDWNALRVAHVVPQTGIELQPEEAYILEQGFERLHGVDFKKGCYVGQEVTSRMKHKTELRKGLVRVELQGPVPPLGTPIERNGLPVGELFTASGSSALAYLRFDRAGDGMTAGSAQVTWNPET
jgi:tRNA-modifying protein YgfZ